MSELPFVSVIIVNFNGQEFITDCIDSVLQSNYPHFEVIIVENGSTDNSWQIIKNKYNDDHQVKLVKSDTNLYFTGGSNLGAQNASGEKIVFLNSDTEVKPSWLKELVNCHLEKGIKSLVQPKILFYNNKNIIDNIGGKYIYPGFGIGIGRGEKDNDKAETPIDYANGTCFLIDKDFFLELNGFDNWFKLHYEDVDLNLRAKKKGGHAYVCLQSVIYHKESLTIRKEIKSSFLLYHIRKNRIQTILNNYNGLSLVTRLFCLIPLYLYWSLKNLSTVRAITKVFHRQLDYLFNLIRYWELKINQKKSKFKLLDLGCGSGTLVKILDNHQINTIGIDPNAPIGKNFIQTTISRFKTNQKYDVITLYHVFEHLDSPAKALEKIKGKLKPNGTLVIETPLLGNLTEKFVGKEYFAYHDQTHQSLMTKDELHTILKKKGFEITGQGLTFYAFPLTIVTTSFRKSILKGILSIFLFIPIKTIDCLLKQSPVIRLYCKHKK